MTSDDIVTQVTAASQRYEMMEMQVQHFQVLIFNTERFNGSTKSRNQDMSFNIKETPWNSRALPHATSFNSADVIDVHVPRAFRAPIPDYHGGNLAKLYYC